MSPRPYGFLADPRTAQHECASLPASPRSSRLVLGVDGATRASKPAG